MTRPSRDAMLRRHLCDRGAVQAYTVCGGAGLRGAPAARILRRVCGARLDAVLTASRYGLEWADGPGRRSAGVGRPAWAVWAQGGWSGACGGWRRKMSRDGLRERLV